MLSAQCFFLSIFLMSADLWNFMGGLHSFSYKVIFKMKILGFVKENKFITALSVLQWFCYWCAIIYNQ